MKLIDLNADGGIGANSLYVQLGDFHLVVDSGLHPKLKGRVAAPISPRCGQTSTSSSSRTVTSTTSAVAAAADARHPNTPVIMTQSSHMLIERMLHNSANVMLRRRREEHPGLPALHPRGDRPHRPADVSPRLQQSKKFAGARDEIEFTFHPAGHIPGAAGVEIHHKHRRIFFTGDVLFQVQRILPGAKFPTGKFDTLVTETTHGATEKPPGITPLQGDDPPRRDYQRHASSAAARC
jgi:Cft2 family RNA processing exonuclease